jgi:arylsulfatase A-like enzyme
MYRRAPILAAPAALCLALLGAPATAAGPVPEAGPPNVVLIYGDDVGYGDLGCYGATRVRTPNLDRLAARGLRFTDAHSAAATCTPSRYALMTGEYAWRRPGTNILPGDATPIIATGRTTLASVLKSAGFATGVVGKWHLGLGSKEHGIDWNGEITPGPAEVGFDESFIIPATGDRVPTVYVEGRRVVGLDPKDPIRVSYAAPVGDEPTGRDRPELLAMKLSHGHDFTIVNGISRIGWMAGGRSARWVDEDMADVLTKRAVSFIERNKQRRFFLYFATHDVHVPRVPHPRFRGRSGCGVRGDAIEELDWSAGEVLAAIERAGIADRTLVIFTSDNGPVLDDGYADGAEADVNGHAPAGPWRGRKGGPYEGGTRVPFLASWPSRIAPGVSDALICQVDLLATLADLAGRPSPEGAGADGVDLLPALLGKSTSGRDDLVEQAAVLAYRRGPWKLITGSRTNPGNGKAKAQAKNAPRDPELFNLADDPGETRDLAAARPDVVKDLTERLDRIRRAGSGRD